jgi:hypothetical protein
MAVSRSPDEDQHLRPTVAGRLHRVPDPTIPAVLSPPIKVASFDHVAVSTLDRRIDFSAICFGTLLHLGGAETHI